MGFNSIKTIRIGEGLLDLTRARVMGIINTTDDSFHAASRVSHESAGLAQAERMIAAGVDILDIGGASSRPGAEPRAVSEEKKSVLASIRAIRSAGHTTPISVDTCVAEVAQAALDVGANIINDITAGEGDPNMLSLVAEYQVPYVIMHKQGRPEDMQDAPSYDDVVLEVSAYFSKRIDLCHSAGITDIILDPGFGFGKTDAHNFSLLRELKHLAQLGYPLLCGISRKSMIQRSLQINATQALNGSTALHMALLDRGADIIRVHDVREAKEVVKLHEMIKASTHS